MRIGVSSRVTPEVQSLCIPVLTLPNFRVLQRPFRETEEWKRRYKFLSQKDHLNKESRYVCQWVISKSFTYKLCSGSLNNSDPMSPIIQSESGMKISRIKGPLFCLNLFPSRDFFGNYSISGISRVRDLYYDYTLVLEWYMVRGTTH